MALYRKYRPASFAEVVGQSHVTTPLSTALDTGRINHAYLFSGPRGCGKTSSARILARSLNCEQGPTSTPCGVCNSCRSLAPGGPGNLDVTELDAASHNGVEDMRELRDRAFYAPAESRYRVFIIDEAHMITNAGSNALLKIVEEPPEHLIFIFATTEPEKVIGTIRSRTHHYPFRLLTPPDMRGLLQRTCEAEGVHVDDDVYNLVIRAGGGSPRDSLSVMDQLLAGAGPDGLTYEMAVPLLGVTDATLIDAAINSLINHNSAELFTTVGNVIDAGHDPRRFASDLLDRLRDLMILQSVENAFELGLVDAPSQAHATLVEQAHAFPPAVLPALAGLVNEGLAEMKGATAPRLLLEILCARLLLPQGGSAAAAAAPAPAAAETTTGYVRPSVRRAREEAARKQQQQQQPQAAVPVQQQPQPAAPAPEQQPQAAAPEPEQRPQAAAQQQPQAVAQQQPQPAVPAQQQPQAAAPEPEQQPQAAQPVASEQQPQPVASEQQPQPSAESDNAVLEQIQQQWSQLRKNISAVNTVAGIMLTEAKPVAVRDNTLILSHNTGALANRLNAESNNKAIVGALQNIGLELAVHCEVGARPAPKAERPTPPQPQPKPEQPAGWQARRSQLPPPEEVPLPPEPDPIEDYAAVEEEMLEQAAEPGERDRRNSMEIAVELVREHLGGQVL